LCEGFEDPTLSAIWAVSQTNGSLSIDTTRAFRGSSSLHIHTDAVASGISNFVGAGEGETFAGNPGDLFFRAYLYIPPPAPPELEVLQVVEATGGELDLELAEGELALNDSWSGTFTRSTARPPINRWTCVEWEVETSPTPQLRVWLDGTPVNQLNLAEATQGAMPNARFRVESAFYQTQANARPAYDLWVDEVIVDKARVGCTK
jgi:hypothetical protein